MSIKYQPELLDELGMVTQRHYSIHSEGSYAEWVRRHAHFHKMQNRHELMESKDLKAEDFLTYLAVEGKVAPAIQNQPAGGPGFQIREQNTHIFVHGN